MARSRKLEASLANLKAIRHDLTSEAAVSTLRQVLQSKQSIAVAQAAKLVHEGELYDLKPELVKAFERFMQKPADTDPGCKAKECIAETLYRLEFSDETLFLQGIHHIQMEKTWGTSVDTAAGLRGICALGLVRMNYPRVMVELADLLADPEPSARANAAKAIAYTDNREGIPLLRLKVRVGDVNPQVLSDCFLGLLKLDPDESLPFVVEFLDTATAEVREMAALAIGESRLEAAFPILQNCWQRSHVQDFRRTALIAIAMLRSDPAIGFLLSLIAEGRKADAQDALFALKMYEHEPALWQRVQAAIEQRSDDELTPSSRSE
ncbi:MAG: HEAT repeat domain-containing protein [Cyanobacteria bacterium J06639_14]